MPPREPRAYLADIVSAADLIQRMIAGIDLRHITRLRAEIAVLLDET